MGNALGQELNGKTVTFKPGLFRPEYGMLEGMPFKVTGGFGANANTSGNALFGMFANGFETRMEGYDVAAIVADSPRLDRMVEIARQAKDDYVAGLPIKEGARRINFRDQEAFVKQRLAEFMQTDATEALAANA